MKRKVIIFTLIFAILLCGCTKKADKEQADNSQSTISAQTQSVSFAQSDKEMFSDRDSKTDYDEQSSATITLSNNSAKANSDTVKIKNNKITITDEGTYIINGKLDDGGIIVDADDTDKLQLIFNNAEITSSDFAPLCILNADKVFITLADGTQNALTNGGKFSQIDDNNVDGALFSKQDLTFNGKGSLAVTSPVGHGIVCKDDLVFCGGKYIVNSSSHALDANDSIRIKDADITATAGKDGVHAENEDDSSLGFIYINSGTFNIKSEGDGISAGAYVQIENGSFNIVTGDGSMQTTKQSSDRWGGFMGGMSGMNMPNEQTDTEDSTSIKGIKAANSMLINEGVFSLDCADDSIHSNNCITVNGGIFELATSDDGVHADQTLTITEGTFNIKQSYEGLEALDIKVSGGSIDIVADDDGINAAGGNDQSGMGGMRPGKDNFGKRGGGGMSAGNGSIVISSGTLSITASGDGIDANGTLEISGGYTTVCGPTQGDTATLDYDTSAVISGGTFIGTGASGMAQTFSDSHNQGVIAVSVGNMDANTEIMVSEKNNKILSYTPELSFAVVIISHPEIKKGESYTIKVGSSTAEFAAS